MSTREYSTEKALCIGIALICVIFGVFALFVLVTVGRTSISTISIREINKTPIEVLGTTVIPPEKALRTYKYVFESKNDNLDSKKYLAAHPEDAINKNYLGEGQYFLRVFSNDLPDPAFFKVS
jgi:hypothetical protein